MVERLTVTKDQFNESIAVLKAHAADIESLFDPILLDERSPDGTVTTIIEYDADSIMIQRIDNKGFEYNVVPRNEYICGARVKS